MALHRQWYNKRGVVTIRVLHTRQLPVNEGSTTPPPVVPCVLHPHAPLYPGLPHFALCASLPPSLLTPPCPVCDIHVTLPRSLSYKDAFELLVVTRKKPSILTLTHLTLVYNNSEWAAILSPGSRSSRSSVRR